MDYCVGSGIGTIVSRCYVLTYSTYFTNSSISGTSFEINFVVSGIEGFSYFLKTSNRTPGKYVINFVPPDVDIYLNEAVLDS